MLAPKLLMSGIGVLAVGGSIAAFNSNIFRNNSVSSSDKDNTDQKTVKKYKYLVVSASEIVIQKVSKTTSTKNQSNNKASFSKENYKCVIPTKNNNSVNDDSCEIYSLNSLTDNNQKVIDLHSITKNSLNKKLEIAPVATQKYILKVSETKLEQMSKDENAKITVVNKDNQTNKYIQFSKEFVLSNENNEFKTNLILAKINSTVDLGSTNTYKCKYKSTQEKDEDCTVYSLKTSSTPEEITSIGKWINPTNLEILSNSSGQKAQNNFVIIKTASEKTEKELRSYVPTIFQNNGTTKAFDAKYISSFVGELNSATTINGNLLTVKPSPQDYLFVIQTSSATKPTAAFADANNKNYKCKISISSVEKVDDSCVLISIENTANKNIDLSKINESNTPVVDKTTISQNKYFKLAVNNNDFISHTFNSESDIITLSSISSNESNNYGTLKVISKIVNEENIGTTSLWLVKSTQNIPQISISGTIKCKFDNSETSTECDIYTKYFSYSYSDFKVLDLSSWAKKTSFTSSAFDKYNYFIVNLKTIKKPISEVDGKNIKISFTPASGTETDISTLKVLAPLHAVMPSDNGNTLTNKPIFLN